MYCPLLCHMFTSLFLFRRKSIRCIRLLKSKPTPFSPFPPFTFTSVHTNTNSFQCPTLTWKVVIYTCVLKTAWDKHIKIMRRRTDSVLVVGVICESFLCVILIREKCEKHHLTRWTSSARWRLRATLWYHFVIPKNIVARILQQSL